MIGHVQRNKVERMVTLASCIHSVDSVRLLRALEQEAAKQRFVIAEVEIGCIGEFANFLEQIGCEV